MDARALRIYMIGAIIVWLGLVAATTIMLSGTGVLFDQIIILGAGAFWFIVLVPGWLRTLGERSTDQ